jgi:hypothetical protein
LKINNARRRFSRKSITWSALPAVEHELLTVAIERILQEPTAPETRRVAEQLPAPQMQARIAHVV